MKINTTMAAICFSICCLLFKILPANAGEQLQIPNSFSPDHSGEVLGISVSGSGCLVAINRAGRLCWSRDAISWHAVYMPVDEFVRGVTFGNGRFVAVGGSYAAQSSSIFTSDNGRRWNTTRCPTRRVLHSVAFGAGRFVAVGADGIILTSENGIRWVERTTPTQATLRAVLFGGDLFVARGDDKSVIASGCGSQWTRLVPPTPCIGELSFHNGSFHIGTSVLALAFETVGTNIVSDAANQPISIPSAPPHLESAK